MGQKALKLTVVKNQLLLRSLHLLYITILSGKATEDWICTAAATNGKKENSRVVIQEFEAPSIYKVKFEGSTGYDIMTYKIESLEDEKITVRYSEDFISEFTVEGKSSKMMEKLNNKRAQRRAKKLLKNIEAYIQNKQNTEDIQEEVEQ